MISLSLGRVKTWARDSNDKPLSELCEDLGTEVVKF